MAKNVADKFGKGITPQQFIDGMEKNKDKFTDWSEQFAWRNEEDKQFFQSLRSREDVRCLILMAEWCGDVVRNVPVVFRAMEESGIPVEVLIMEQHMETMDEFLTMGGRAVPIVIFADNNGAVLGQWGPRPKHVQAIMIEFKKHNPDREAPDYNDNIQVARQEMLKQYGEGTGYQDVIVKELRELLSTF
ncbi:thioredoxin family protein [Paenibacillus sp. J2TS4]|uniref:thioredoxin family protein n=1 Tax=Paenibacillus sp. J2TS4 TaxID=2807194 RepID=UPI001B17A392|nr:thioredoxin family protein [Paenibacillus sp. J2TS4]GIP35429.1 thioredoxin [Paenibacillus sp. J2TS4]